MKRFLSVLIVLGAMCSSASAYALSYEEKALVSEGKDIGKCIAWAREIGKSESSLTNHLARVSVKSGQELGNVINGKTSTFERAMYWRGTYSGYGMGTAVMHKALADSGGVSEAGMVDMFTRLYEGSCTKYQSQGVK